MIEMIDTLWNSRIDQEQGKDDDDDDDDDDTIEDMFG